MAKTTDELRAERNALMAKRDASTDPAERARLLAQMKAISDEITNRSLDAGAAESGAVKDLEKSLDAERTRTSTDAISAGVRGARDVQDSLRGGGKGGGDK
ncbi:MAG TPA: hypothetical protein VF603_07165 [Allosphingosinicella sp.]|jgi:flagellar hook-length control protein FliK